MTAETALSLVGGLRRIAKVGFGYDLSADDRKVLRDAGDLIDQLTRERDEARAALEHDRSIVIGAVNSFKEAFARRSWLLDGRGPYEWDDDRYRDEFHAAYDELAAPIEALCKVGRDWSNCPQEPRHEG